VADDLSLLARPSPWMRAVEAASAPAWAAPVELITDFADPWKCPAHLLYALALENSVDIWDETWSEPKKRSVIERSIELHRLKGSLAGIKAYVDIAGGVVKRATAPPQGIYAGGENEADRTAWLSRFPEFRLYTQAPWSTDPDDAYAGEAFAGGGDYPGSYAPTNPDTRLQFRAGVLIKDGVNYDMTRRETFVVVDGAELLVETFIPTDVDGVGAYAEEAWPGDFIVTRPSLPALTVSTDLPALGRPDAATYAFQGPFIESRPERVATTAEDPAGAYADIDYADEAFLDRGIDPALLCFDRWRLADQQRSAGAVAPDDSFFGDETLLGLPAFTLLLDIQVDETAPAMTAFAGGFEGDFPEAADTRRTDLVLEAVRSAAADRDQVLVRFARHRPLRLGDRPTLPVRLGQLVADF